MRKIYTFACLLCEKLLEPLVFSSWLALHSLLDKIRILELHLFWDGGSTPIFDTPSLPKFNQNLLTFADRVWSFVLFKNFMRILFILLCMFHHHPYFKYIIIMFTFSQIFWIRRMVNRATRKPKNAYIYGRTEYMTNCVTKRLRRTLIPLCVHRQTSQPAKQFVAWLAPIGNTHIIHRHLLFCYTQIKLAPSVPTPSDSHLEVV
jgi:hypothetical protein